MEAHTLIVNASNTGETLQTVPNYLKLISILTTGSYYFWEFNIIKCLLLPFYLNPYIVCISSLYYNQRIVSGFPMKAIIFLVLIVVWSFKSNSETTTRILTRTETDAQTNKCCKNNKRSILTAFMTIRFLFESNYGNSNNNDDNRKYIGMNKN